MCEGGGGSRWLACLRWAEGQSWARRVDRWSQRTAPTNLKHCVHSKAPANAQMRVLNPRVGSVMSGKANVMSTELGRVHVAVSRTPTEQTGGASSFGYSGTIVHAALRTMRHVSARAPQSMPLVYERDSLAWHDPPHPFARGCVPSSDNVVTVRSAAQGILHQLIADHVVKGQIFFPGTGYLEMARATVGMALRGVFFLQPLVIRERLTLVECTVRD